MSFKLDIFKLMNDIDTDESFQLYSKLSEDERKSVSPLVVMRWLTGTSDRAQILLMNQLVNVHVWSLAQHQQLLMQLMSAASSRIKRRYQWIPIQQKKKGDLAKRVLMERYGYSSREVSKLSVFPSGSDIIQYAEELGWQKDELTKLKKELDQ